MTKSCGAPQPGVNRFSYPLYLAPSAYEAGFVSAAHGAAEIEATLAAAREAFKA